ncbi:MAG: DMT family transporter [Cyclobacteriaceae bacterium]|nr:DMT family transporter [Cyclobacteriaceae bacterium]
METILIIGGRVLASPLVNVFQKKLTNRHISPDVIVALSYGFFVLFAIPALFILQPFDYDSEFWIYIALLGVLDGFGNYFLVKSLRTTDLSVFGPLNAFKPVFALAFSAILLNEIPSIVGIFGVAIIIAGSYVLSYRRGMGFSGFKTLFIDRGIFFRFLAIALTAIAAVFSKKTILLSSPLVTFIYWSIIGLPLTITLLLFNKVNWKQELRQIAGYKLNLVLLLLCFMALQIFTLLTFQKVFVGYSLALFQLSAVLSVLFGAHFFNEKDFAVRLTGSVIMIIGTLLIIYYG